MRPGCLATGPFLAMKAMPTDDDAFDPGFIRRDGRRTRPAYLFVVKVPADPAFPPIADGRCSLS